MESVFSYIYSRASKAILASIMIQHTALVRKATYVIGFTSIILGVILISSLLIYKTFFLPESIICDQWLPSSIYPAQLSGRVVSVTQDVTSTDTCRVQVEIENFGSLLWCNCSSKELISPQIHVGDSIKKNPNSLIVTICSPSLNCATLAFPCCD